MFSSQDVGFSRHKKQAWKRPWRHKRTDWNRETSRGTLIFDHLGFYALEDWLLDLFVNLATSGIPRSGHLGRYGLAVENSRKRFERWKSADRSCERELQGFLFICINRCHEHLEPDSLDEIKLDCLPEAAFLGLIRQQCWSWEQQRGHSRSDASEQQASINSAVSACAFRSAPLPDLLSETNCALPITPQSVSLYVPPFIILHSILGPPILSCHFQYLRP